MKKICIFLILILCLSQIEAIKYPIKQRCRCNYECCCKSGKKNVLGNEMSFCASKCAKGSVKTGWNCPREFYKYVLQS